MKMDFDYHNYLTSKKLKKVNDKNVKSVSHLILKISFLTLFGSSFKISITQYMVRWKGVVLMTPKPCDNHIQRVKQISKLKTYKLEIKIGAIF